MVFQHIPFDNMELLYKFIKFVHKLSWNTELRLILVIDQKEANNNIFEDTFIPVVNLNYLTRTEAVELLQRIIYIEGKTALVKGINLETHKVMDMWEKLNFIDNEGFNISGRLSKRRKLIDIANDMQKRRALHQIDEN